MNGYGRIHCHRGIISKVCGPFRARMYLPWVIMALSYTMTVILGTLWKAGQKFVLVASGVVQQQMSLPAGSVAVVVPESSCQDIN